MPHHVEQRAMADNRAEQIGTLRQRGADQQTAVASACNRELRRLRIAIRDEPIPGGDEIIEDVLLSLPPPCLVPFLAEFAAATDVS
jgi:hypothetical protein